MSVVVIWFCILSYVSALTVHNGEYVRVKAGLPMNTYWMRLDFHCTSPPVLMHSLLESNTVIKYDATNGGEYFYLTDEPIYLDYTITVADTTNYRTRKSYHATLCMGHGSELSLKYKRIGIQGNVLVFGAKYSKPQYVEINTTRIESYGDLPPQYIKINKHVVNTTLPGPTDLGYGFAINGDVVFDYIISETSIVDIGSTEQVPIKQMVVLVCFITGVILIMDLDKNVKSDPIRRSLIITLLMCNYTLTILWSIMMFYYNFTHLIKHYTYIPGEILCVYALLCTIFGLGTMFTRKMKRFFVVSSNGVLIFTSMMLWQHYNNMLFFVFLVCLMTVWYMMYNANGSHKVWKLVMCFAHFVIFGLFVLIPSAYQLRIQYFHPIVIAIFLLLYCSVAPGVALIQYSRK